MSGLNGSILLIVDIPVANVIFREPEANLLGKLYSETIYAHASVTSLASGPIIISVVVQHVIVITNNYKRFYQPLSSSPDMLVEFCQH